MTQLAAREDREWVRTKVAERGWTAEIEAEAAKALERRSSWNELFALAYTDGANNRELWGHRLENYATCYADIAGHADCWVPLAVFWFFWQRGDFDAEVYGPWHVVAS